ncbi:UNVERIFIED_ORG: hypothetical protein M2312_003783 [Rhizobium esperanzae]|nr:hypothetical protein [Rhizobium esperanzae]
MPLSQVLAMGRGATAGQISRALGRAAGLAGAENLFRRRQQAFALQLLAGKLTLAANGLALFAGPLLGRLLIGTAGFHFPEQAFALHLFLEHTQRLIDIIIPDENLQNNSFLSAAASLE